MKINSAKLTFEIEDELEEEREINISLSQTQFGAIIKLLGIKINALNETATMFDDRTLADITSRMFNIFKEVP